MKCNALIINVYLDYVTEKNGGLYPIAWGITENGYGYVSTGIIVTDLRNTKKYLHKSAEQKYFAEWCRLIIKYLETYFHDLTNSIKVPYL